MPPDPHGSPLERAAFALAAEDRKPLLGTSLIYDSSTSGRSYVQSDPIALKGGPNAFAYAGGDPTRYVDSFGLFCTWGAGSQDGFVHHYFYGGGSLIDLGTVGLLTAFQNAESVQAAVFAFNNQLDYIAAQKAGAMCRNCSQGTQTAEFSYADTTTTNVTDVPCLFSVGSSTFFRSADCSVSADCQSKTYSYTCSTKFKIRDWFRDPLDIGEITGHNVEVPGGTPYRINADWNSSTSGSGSF